MHSEQVRRHYTFVTTCANLTAATLVLGLTTFTMGAMQTALPLYARSPGDSVAAIFSTILSRCAMFFIVRYKPFLILGDITILHSLGCESGFLLRTRRYLQ